MNVLRRYVPIVSWLPNYERRWFSHDAIAGLTIWGLLVPEMIAYAGLAGLSPQAGLYTLLASLGIYAIFGTSRHLVVAGTSASAVLVYSAVSAVGHGHYETLAAAMIMLCGLCLLLGGLFRLGFITAFLSRPVMDGFVFGLAIFVVVSQLPKLFGLDKGKGDTVRQLAHLIANLNAASVWTLIVGVTALVALFAFERFLPRIPGGLLVLAFGIGFSAMLDLSSHGVATVGKIPAGLPSVSFPHIAAGDLWVLLPSALGMMLVIFSEALGAGQAFADKHGYRLESSQEMIALGLSNIFSGLLGGLACGGSLSQSAVNEGAGARSEMSPIIAAGLSLITVIALTPIFKDLPEAVLAALIIHAVSHLMKVSEMRRYYALIPREFWLGMLTLGGVVVFDVLPGLIIGVGLSLLLFVYRASRPHVSTLGPDPTIADSYEDVTRHPEARPIPGVLIIRPDAPLFYANAQAVRDMIEATVTSAGDIHSVIVDIDSNDEIDITTSEQLQKLAENLAANRVALAFAHAHAPVLEMLGRSGLDRHIGPGRVFVNLPAAVAWATARQTG